MNNQKILAFLISAIMCAPFAYADQNDMIIEDSGNGYASEDSEGSAPQAPRAKTVDEDYEDWANETRQKMLAKCQRKAIPESNIKCQFDVIIAKGEAPVKVNPSHPKYIDSRYAAYMQAMQNAYMNMAKNIELKATAEVVSKMFDDETPPNLDSLKNKTYAESVWEKIKALGEAELDNLLIKHGIDPSKFKKEPESVRKQIFEDSIRTKSTEQAIADTTGLSVIQTFFGADDDGTEKIIVAVSQSPERVETMKTILHSQGNTRPIPEFANPRPVSAWYSVDPKVLINQFGTRIVFDNKGNPIIISYGQAGYIKNTNKTINSKNKSSAEIMADSRAQENITLLLNNSTNYKRVVEQIQKEYITNKYTQEEDYSITESQASDVDIKQKIEQEIRSFGQVKISGIKNVRTWRYDVDDKLVIVGVVKMWSPQSAQVAQQIKEAKAQKPSEEPIVLKNDNSTNSGTSGSVRGLESDDYDF